MKVPFWRIAVIVAALAASLLYALPSLKDFRDSPLGRLLPDARINLGLDLKGGMHLTLGVDVQKAVDNALLQTAQDIRLRAADKGITILRPRLIGRKVEFLLPKADQEAALNGFLKDYFGGLAVSSEKLDAGGLRYFGEFTERYAKEVKDMALEQVVRTLRNRIDQFGVAEPDIRKQADYRIQIQLPGLSDPERAIQLVGQTAQLTFHLVRDDINSASPLPPGVAMYPQVIDKASGSASESRLPLNRDPLMTGEDVVDARPSFGQDGRPYVALSFNGRGAAAFERVTGEHIHKRMAIVLDGKVYTAPVIQDRIAGGRASITGNFTTDEAKDLSIVLRAGSLPAPVSVLEERNVGPSLGQESVEKGLIAAAVGAAAVVVIMLLCYGVAGLIADIMLVFTILILMAGLAAFGATLTLPGIAGIVLTIGMSVDANVLIFERIREEAKKGCTAWEGVRAGFDRASVSITDSNLTTIITAAILYQFGTGPVRGFAVTLTLGIIASMFTAIFASRVIFELWAAKRGDKSLSI